MKNKWRRSEEWQRDGDGFRVVVKHTKNSPGPFSDRGPHYWYMYAYIYLWHPLFSTFTGPDINQPATRALPLHGGPTYFQRHCPPGGTSTAVQIGADYRHDGDNHFTFASTPTQASEVFDDADALFDYLLAAAAPAG